jgi:hypothetical protein
MLMQAELKATSAEVIQGIMEAHSCLKMYLREQGSCNGEISSTTKVKLQSVCSLLEKGTFKFPCTMLL